MDDQLETGKKTSKVDEEFVAPRNDIEQDQTSTETPAEVDDQAESQPELEITPEIEAKVMEKVQDILEYGTAFTGVALYQEEYKDEILEKINSCLMSGLVGTINRKKIDLVDYRKNLELEKSIKVYFQIVGRTHKMLSSNDYKNNTYSYGVGSVSFIFDINKYQELRPGDEHISMPSWNFQANLGGERPRETRKQNKWEKAGEMTNQFNEHGDIMVDPDFGFSLSPRVPPQFLEGMVITRRKGADNLEDTEMLTVETNLLAKCQTEVYNKNPRFCLPIYDSSGNLLWPRQMSYEEVTQFVAERDAKKKDETLVESVEGSEESADTETASETEIE